MSGYIETSRGSPEDRSLVALNDCSHALSVNETSSAGRNITLRSRISLCEAKYNLSVLVILSASRLKN